MSVGNIRKLQEASGEHRSTAYWEKNSPGKRYQRIQICLTGEVEASSSPIRLWDIRMWNVGGQNCGGEMSVHGIPPQLEWAMLRKGDRLRVQGVGTPLPDDSERARLSGSTPSGFPKRTCAAMLSGTREHHSPNDSISYPDMLSGSLTTVSKPYYSPRSAALQWCPDIFCHGFQITLLNLGLLWWSKSYQNTKT